MNYEQDDHKSADYDRQSCAYRCGRGARWRKPCWQGPGATGKCGGIAECVPLRRGDRYYCQRPQHAGGACKQGPLPDGGCAHAHTPCTPVAGIRRIRGRLTLLGLLLVIALITIFSDREPGSELIAMINPGELSSAHSGFPVADQCENCHEAHGKNAANWFASAFEYQDITKKCIQCHKLVGPEKAPHNRFDEDNIELECKACHHEHKGLKFDISNVPNKICSNCHEQAFADLSHHVKFPPGYPHQEPQNIFFDHATHLDEYFVENKWLKKQNRDAGFAKKARATCSTCHQIKDAIRDVPIRDYEKICASCHEFQIGGRALTILTPDEVPPAMLGLIIGANEEVPDVEVAAKKLINIIANKGIDGLMKTVEEAGEQKSVQKNLFSGLNPTALRATARAWQKKQSFKTASSANDQMVGWKTGENDDGAEAIMYKAKGHADATLKNWIELYLNKSHGDQSEHAEEALEALLDASEGPGACGKCHAVLMGAKTQNKDVFNWGKTAVTIREHTSGFSHRPHIDLLGQTEGCDACHKFNEHSNYPAYFKDGASDVEKFESSFSDITLQTCTKCHNQKRVSADCQLCHSYHRDVGFQFEYQEQEKERMSP